MSLPQVSPVRYSLFSEVLASWSVYEASIRTDLTSNALLTSEGWWIVDPSAATEELLSQFSSGKPVLGILLTNENHERAAFSLGQRLGYAVHAHEATLGLMEQNSDFFFRDGDLLKGGVRVLHLPGASAGETAFYDPFHRIIIVGDALIHLKETGFTVLPDKYCRDPVGAKRSLVRLLDLEFELMAFAHGEPLTRDPKQKLQVLLNHL